MTKIKNIHYTHGFSRNTRRQGTHGFSPVSTSPPTNFFPHLLLKPPITVPLSFDSSHTYPIYPLTPFDSSPSDLIDHPSPLSVSRSLSLRRPMDISYSINFYFKLTSSKLRNYYILDTVWNIFSIISILFFIVVPPLLITSLLPTTTKRSYVRLPPISNIYQ